MKVSSAALTKSLTDPPPSTMRGLSCAAAPANLTR